MATLRNLRAYAPGSNDTDTTKVAVDASDTGSANGGILRKINLNVDLATQNELNEAFLTLSAAISSTQGDLDNYYTKSEVNTISTDLSTALTGDIDAAVAAEAALREAADNAITASLSAYEVTVEKDTTAAEGYAATYTVKQGGVALSPKINIPKDYLVKSAELKTVETPDVPYTGAKVGDKYIDFTINTADASEIAQHIYLPVNDLVDVYTGAETDTATVTVGDDNSISVAVKDYVSKTYVDGVSAEVSAAAAADIAAAEAAAKAYTDEVSTAISSAFEPRVADNETVSEFVREMSATWGGGGTAIQTVAGDNVYLTATTDENKNVVVAATADLCAVVAKVEAASADWDEVSAKADLTAVNELTSALSDAISSEATRATAAEEALSGEINGLSAIYKTIAKVNNAVSSTRFDLPISDDYEDIDDIIADILEIRKALNMLRETSSGGGGGSLPTGYDFYGIVELPEAGTSERALYGVTNRSGAEGQYDVTLLKSKATEATFADTDAAFESDSTTGIIAVTHNGYATGYSLADDGEGGYYLSRCSGDSEGQSYATFTEVTVAAAETFYNS